MSTPRGSAPKVIVAWPCDGSRPSHAAGRFFRRFDIETEGECAEAFMSRLIELAPEMAAALDAVSRWLAISPDGGIYTDSADDMERVCELVGRAYGIFGCLRCGSPGSGCHCWLLRMSPVRTEDAVERIGLLREEVAALQYKVAQQRHALAAAEEALAAVRDEMGPEKSRAEKVRLAFALVSCPGQVCVPGAAPAAGGEA